MTTKSTETEEQAPGAAVEGKFFTLYCGDEVFGLPVEHAQTIFRVGSVTPVPLGRPEIIGLVNLRGKIVTAISLRQRLRLPPSKDSGLAIGLEHGGDHFALVVDQVGDVIELDSSMQIPIPSHFDPERSKLTSGLFKLEKMLVPILDVDAVIELDR